MKIRLVGAELFHADGQTDMTQLNLGFVVSCIFKYSNKTPNQMQQSVVKCIA
jgi:hypothetical protein